MYEPRYLPQLTEETVPLPKLRFSVFHSKKFSNSQHPDVDPLHIHKELELFFNLSCDVSFTVNGEIYPVQNGDIVISKPGDIHMAIFNKSTIQEHICLWIEADFNLPIFSFLKKENCSPLRTFDPDTKNALQSLFISLNKTVENGDQNFAATACLFQILAIIDGGSTSYATQISIPENIRKIVDYMQKNFTTISSINDISSRYFISQSTLTRWFRKYMHSSPRDYLESVRLSHAIKLLNEGFSVTNACIQSGFSDCSHFSALFKRKFGETPLRYKLREKSK